MRTNTEKNTSSLFGAEAFVQVPEAFGIIAASRLVSLFCLARCVETTAQRWPQGKWEHGEPFPFGRERTVPFHCSASSAAPMERSRYPATASQRRGLKNI